MATEILRPQDCLSAQSFQPFSPHKLFPNRRKSRPVRTNQTAPSPTPKTRYGRPNPKSNRKSPSPPSTSPPPTPPLSTSPVQDGFRLLKRGEAFQPVRPGSETESPVGKTTQLVKKRADPNPAQLWTSPPKAVSPSRRPELSNRVERTPPPPQKKNQSDRVGSRPEPTALPPPVKPDLVGSDELRYAGLNCSLSAPAPECVPKPVFLVRSTSVGPTSDDEASRTLRGLLKLDFM